MNSSVSMYDMVENIVQVVINTHYSFVTDPELKKDLTQTGFLKAYELLNSGNYDPNLALRNYIYTGVRNEIHNVLYHLGKVSVSSLDTLDVYDNVIGYTQTKEYDIDLSIVKEVCDKFKFSGDYYVPVLKYLNDIGMITFDPKGYDLKNYNQEMLEGIITIVLWKLYDREVVNEF